MYFIGGKYMGIKDWIFYESFNKFWNLPVWRRDSCFSIFHSLASCCWREGKRKGGKWDFTSGSVFIWCSWSLAVKDTKTWPFFLELFHVFSDLPVAGSRQPAFRSLQAHLLWQPHLTLTPTPRPFGPASCDWPLCVLLPGFFGDFASGWPTTTLSCEWTSAE